MTLLMCTSAKKYLTEMFIYSYLHHMLFHYTLIEAV